MKKSIFIITSICITILSITALSLFFYQKELPPIKVGILHSMTGSMAISEIPVMQATLLAIEKINAHGGLLGRQVEAIVVDGKSDEITFEREAKRLIIEEKVSVIFGCWTSASRKTVLPIFEKYNHLLFYPVQYEGLEQSPNIIYMGAAPNQQIIPAVNWAIQRFGPRIYLMGSDYVFPHVANWLIKKQANALHASVVGEQYIPFNHYDVKKIIQEIKRLQPDFIMNTINGDANIAFFHALREEGLSAKDAPVISFSLGEAELAHMHDDQDITGHYAAWNYFQSIDSQENRDFIRAYQKKFGAQPLSDPMEAAWASVHLWAKAVKSAQTDNTESIRQSIVHQSILAPEGVLSIDKKTQHAWKKVRIGIIRANRQFETIWSSKNPIRPAPYPLIISKPEADMFLSQLYENWDQHWTQPVIKKKNNHFPMQKSQL
ncbi:MAG: urea ABC transporter substrate-binding protein [Mariprofundaceae bacterium]|nr:urea ABC transporter substrate-binding protein [Mariprofundaceae bacterium]